LRKSICFNTKFRSRLQIVSARKAAWMQAHPETRIQSTTTDCMAASRSVAWSDRLTYQRLTLQEARKAKRAKNSSRSSTPKSRSS